MGQYFKLVNLDKREFVDPHKLGVGLKQWEQLAGRPGTAAAAIVLLSAQREMRGGGDLDPEQPGGKVIGSWAGDRVALIGDYAEADDLPARNKAELIYSLCGKRKDVEEVIAYWEETCNPKARRLRRELDAKGPYRDISDKVAAVIERELEGKFSDGPGWRNWTGQY